MILGNKIDELAKAVNALKETTQPLKEMPQFARQADYIK
jgi:hypothetical protein